MTVKWKKEYNPGQIIQGIESNRRIDDDGKQVHLGLLELKEFDVLIYSMLEFPNNVSETDARGIVFRAVFNAVIKGTITSKTLLEEVNRLELEYQSLPVEKFVLVSSISMNSSLELKKIKSGNALVTFEPLPPPKFRKETELLLKDAERQLFANLPVDYLGVRVFVSAKSVNHAASQALEELDLVRGIWNWLLNKQQPRRISGGKPQPVNKIILGPIHTLHKPSGNLATNDTWWYEPNYLGAIKPYSPKQNEFDAIGKAFAYVKKVLKTHKYSDVIQSAIIRYTRALDERDWTTAFIKLWSVLELLTDTSRGGYDTTIRRVAFLYREHEYHTQVLQHLREYRNSSVHLDKGNSEVEIYLYQIKGYVETLIRFHMNSKYKFESIQEASGFLSLSYEQENLKTQIDKLKFARKIRGYK